MTALNSILPLVDNFLKSSEIVLQQTEDSLLPEEDPSVEDARFVLHQVGRLDKELAAVSRGETIDMVDEQALAGIDQSPLIVGTGP
jgi:hypothetical protein